MKHAHLPWHHALLALAVVAVWGTNFVVIREALQVLPPLTLATLRYILAFLPAALLIPRPALPWTELALYGVLIGVGQFALLFIAMQGHITPGLASLVIQTQVFFTIGLAMWRAGERLARFQWLALALAAAGLGVIGSHTDGHTTPLGLGLVLVGAFNWACGNLVARRAVGVNMLAYVAPALFLFTIHIAMQAFQTDVIIPILFNLGFITSLEVTPINLIFVYLIDFLYIIVFLGLVFYSMHLTNKH